MSVARQFVRFAAFGAVATAAHYTLMIGLIELGHTPPLWATTAGFVLGAIVSYTLNRRFTFDETPAFGRGLMLFLCVAAIGLVLNGAIFAVLHGPPLSLPYLLAQVIATGLVLIWNFLGARLFVFRR